MKLATYSVLTFAMLVAQSPATVSFDAASIKLNNSGQRGTSMRVLPGGASRPPIAR